MPRQKIDLMFNDDAMGHDDIGWMPRDCTDPDDEDAQYERFVRTYRPDLRARNPRVIDMILFLDEVQPAQPEG